MDILKIERWLKYTLKAAPKHPGREKLEEIKSISEAVLKEESGNQVPRYGYAELFANQPNYMGIRNIAGHYISAYSARSILENNDQASVYEIMIQWDYDLDYHLNDIEPVVKAASVINDYLDCGHSILYSEKITDIAMSIAVKSIWLSIVDELDSFPIDENVYSPKEIADYRRNNRKRIKSLLRPIERLESDGVLQSIIKPNTPDWFEFYFVLLAVKFLSKGAGGPEPIREKMGITDEEFALDISKECELQSNIGDDYIKIDTKRIAKSLMNLEKYQKWETPNKMWIEDLNNFETMIETFMKGPWISLAVQLNLPRIIKVDSVFYMDSTLE